MRPAHSLEATTSQSPPPCKKKKKKRKSVCVASLAGSRPDTNSSPLAWPLTVHASKLNARVTTALHITSTSHPTKPTQQPRSTRAPLPSSRSSRPEALCGLEQLVFAARPLHNTQTHSRQAHTHARADSSRHSTQRVGRGHTGPQHKPSTIKCCFRM